MTTASLLSPKEHDLPISAADTAKDKFVRSCVLFPLGCNETSGARWGADTAARDSIRLGPILVHLSFTTKRSYQSKRHLCLSAVSPAPGYMAHTDQADGISAINGWSQFVGLDALYAIAKGNKSSASSSVPEANTVPFRQERGEDLRHIGN